MTVDPACVMLVDEDSTIVADVGGDTHRMARWYVDDACAIDNTRGDRGR